MILVLASGSPRRKQLLQMIQPNFLVEIPQVNEASVLADTVSQTALLRAKAKAENIALTYRYKKMEDYTILGCDTIVELDGEILSKPKNQEDVVEMISKLSNRQHHVYTGVYFAYINKFDIKFKGDISKTTVYFNHIPLKEIEQYSQTKEPYDKAGGYGIQGWASRYIPSIRGCYYNVMGLPVSMVYDLSSILIILFFSTKRLF